jgi:hypothetical protein
MSHLLSANRLCENEKNPTYSKYHETNSKLG